MLLVRHPSPCVAPARPLCARKLRSPVAVEVAKPCHDEHAYDDDYIVVMLEETPGMRKRTREAIAAIRAAHRDELEQKRIERVRKRKQLCEQEAGLRQGAALGAM